MKNITEYIYESTRVLITKNKTDETKFVITAGSDNKFFKGNKNNVGRIEGEITSNTKTHWDLVTGVKITRILLVDDTNSNPHDIKPDEFKNCDAIQITQESDHYLIKVGKSEGNAISASDCYTMPVEKIFRNTLGDVFDVKG